MDAQAFADSHTGTYTLSASALNTTPNDDYAGDTSTTGSINCWKFCNWKSRKYGDSDWFAITLDAGETYQFDQIGPSDAFLYLRDSSGNLITYDDQNGGDNDARIFYEATQSGIYYLDATAYEDSFTGSYTLVASLLDTIPDDYAGDTSTTGRLEVGGSVSGEIETYGDRDWFAVTLDSGILYTISAFSDYGYSSTGDGAEIIIRDQYGSYITEYGGLFIEEESFSFDFTAQESGTYFLDFGAQNNSGYGTYEISLNINNPAPTDDYSSDTSTTGSLTVGSSVTGNLETYGDSDWFAITLEAGATYQFDQIGPYDAFLYLRDSSGNLITYDDQSGPGAINDAQIIYEATQSGTYYLDATAYADSHTGTYTVAASLISDGGGGVDDDYASDTSTTGSLTVGSSVTGNLETYGDSDWFAITLEAGATYQFDQMALMMRSYI